jgi:hypothetical protein
MPRVSVDEEKLIVELKGIEKILAVKRRLKITLNCIEKIVHIKDLDEVEREQICPRIRLGGFSLGAIKYGTFVTGVGRGFFATKDLEKSIVIYLSSCTPYKIVVIEASDPETLETLKKSLRKRGTLSK